MEGAPAEGLLLPHDVIVSSSRDLRQQMPGTQGQKAKDLPFWFPVFACGETGMTTTVGGAGRRYIALMPPSTFSSAPVTSFDSSEAR
jgi:hypothetical protein